MIYKNSKSYAKILDQQDPLSKCRNKFFYPKKKPMTAEQTVGAKTAIFGPKNT